MSGLLLKIIEDPKGLCGLKLEFFDIYLLTILE